MTDPWSRPAGDGPVVEIELSGGEPLVSRPSDPPAARERHGRGRFVLLLAGAAIAAAVVVAIAGRDGDDEAADAPATTLDTSQITTPPTLDTLPPATLPAITGDTGPDATGVPGRGTQPGVDSPDMTFPGEEVFDPATVTVPVYDELPNVVLADLDDYDLLTAAAVNTTGGTPMRTTVRLRGVHVDGLFGTEARAVITNDPDAARDALRIERDVGEAAEIVADRTTGTVYRTDTGIGGRWELFSGEVFLEGTGAATVDELFDALVEGPMTAENLATATSIDADDGLVRLDGGAIARRWHVVIPIDGLRPYGQLLLAGVSEQTVDQGTAPTEIGFDAYVTDQGRLALVAARFESDDLVYGFEQFFDRRPANVIIDLPAADAVLPRSAEPAP